MPCVRNWGSGRGAVNARWFSARWPSSWHVRNHLPTQIYIFSTLFFLLLHATTQPPNQTRLSLPGVETPVGHVTFTLSSINANNANLGRNNISTNANGLTLTIADGSIALTASWKYRENSFPYVAAPRGPLHEVCSTRVAIRGPLHGGVADLFYTDVRSILMILWDFKGASAKEQQKAAASIWDRLAVSDID